jgi:hypothetical protein
VPLDVMDPEATAALQAAKARQIPLIFRRSTNAPAAMEQKFLTAFAEARTDFLTELAKEYHSGQMPRAAIASADFGYLVTAFNVEHKEFPVTEELASEWARGRDGLLIRRKYLALLQQMERRPIGPDNLPGDFASDKTIRLLPVSDTNQCPSPDHLPPGELMPATNLIKISYARSVLRSSFSADQQLSARALAGFLQPNCVFDSPLTRLVRDQAVGQIRVTRHFDAGDVLVHRGDPLNAQVQVALETLNATLTAPPSAAPAAVSHPRQIALVSNREPSTRNGAIPHPGAETRIKTRPFWQLPAWAVVSMVSLSLMLAAGWKILRNRAATNTSRTPARASELNLPSQVNQAVRDAVARELGQQRHALLVTQHAATDEISRLVRHFDHLQLPGQERLQEYEARIQALERELGQRNEETRELVKMKINLIRQQMASEHIGKDAAK